MAAFTTKRAITYPLLSDPNSAVIDRYGLRDPQYPPSNKGYGVPRPIILIIGPDGAIKAKLHEETYQKRPPLSLILDTLDKLEMNASPPSRP